MMKKVLSALILIMSACSFMSEGKAFRELEKWLEQHDNKYSYAVIIPGGGCEGCISNAEHFAKEYSGRSDVLFVFTQIETLKLLKHKLGEQVSSSLNILYDVDNRFEETEKGINNIYPVVCFIENNEVVDWFYISPEQKRDVLGELKKKLDSQARYQMGLEDYLDNPVENDLVLSQLVDSLEYVPLQTPEDLPVGVLVSVKITGEDIFVLDSQQLLYRFDRNGVFANLIGHKGQGPEEYLTAVEFDIDEEGKVVYVYDNFKNKIIAYDFRGKFVESTPFPEGVINASLLDFNHFIGYKPAYMSKLRKEQLVMFGDGDEMEFFDLNEGIMPENTKIDIFRMSSFNYMQGNCYVRVPHSDFIYGVSESDRIYKYMEIGQGKYLLPKEIAVNTRLYNDNLNSSYIFELNTLLTDRYVYLNFFLKRKMYRLVYDVFSSEFYAVCKNAKPMGVVNDLGHGIPFWPSWICSDKVVGVVPLDYLEANRSDAFCSRLISYDNPVLQIGYY